MFWEKCCLIVCFSHAQHIFVFIIKTPKCKKCYRNNEINYFIFRIFSRKKHCSYRCSWNSNFGSLWNQRWHTVHNQFNKNSWGFRNYTWRQQIEASPKAKTSIAALCTSKFSENAFCDLRIPLYLHLTIILSITQLMMSQIHSLLSVKCTSDRCLYLFCNV